MTAGVEQASYLHLIRTNANFRRLWIGDIISLLGDWFNTIAIYSLIERLTGSPLAMGLVFVTKLLPLALASPIAGLIVDRWNRRTVMITTDLLRAIVVLGFLFVGESSVWLIYLLTALQVVIGAAFIPARTASIPNVTAPHELLTANALMAATWSAMLALGAAAGGFATALLGEQTVFIIDSLSYLLSAFFIYRAVIPQETEAAAVGPVVRTAISDIASGWRYMRDFPEVGRIAFAKFTWAMGGSSLVFMLTLIGGIMMPGETAIGIGILFALRGLGTGIGPLVARNVFTNKLAWPMLLGVCTVCSGIFYSLVPFVPWAGWGIALVGLFVMFSHAFSGANWVLSTVLLQERSVDQFRGRVFATEWLLITLVDALMIAIASVMLETVEGLTVRLAVSVAAGIQILCGLFWIWYVVPREKSWVELSG